MVTGPWTILVTCLGLVFLENVSRCSTRFLESDGVMNVEVSLVKCLGSLYLSCMFLLTLLL